MANNLSIVNQATSIEEVTLPNTVVTRSGVEFDPRYAIWSYRDSTKVLRLDFQKVHGVTNDFITSMKSVLCWYAENRAPDHLKNMFVRLQHLCETLSTFQKEPISCITSTHILNYRNTLNGKHAWYLSSVSGILKKWHQLGLPGVSSDVVRLLEQLKLQGNSKGEAVRTMDPNLGPFTDIERDAIGAALHDAYATSRISQDKYLLAWLFVLLGQRPVQYAALKVSDVTSERLKDGTCRYWVNIPRAKQQQTLSRTEFRQRPLTPQIGEMLLNYAGKIRKLFKEALDDSSQAPLFPQKKLESMVAPIGFEYHQTSDGVAAMLVNTMKSLSVYSERTGQPLHINARRFRHTLGTNAAREGHGKLIIAELLDHSDTQNVEVYVQNSPEIIERIDRAIATEIAPLAQAFAGTLIRDESEAIRADDPTSRIIDPRIDPSFKPMGNCGTYSFCSFAAPIACYTCRNFQPWLDGPHEAVLNHLLSERERLKASTDQRIASINDRTIFAVEQVVKQCREILAHEGNVHG